MPIDSKLEHYLARLDKALSQIAISDRADIITEIKSHVLEAVERDPSQSVAAVLASLGDPETVANRYLIERGFKPGKPARAPVVKWLTIGFLGTFAIAATFVLIVIWRFTPLIQVDEKAGRVVLLGGLIDINDLEGEFRVGGDKFTHERSHRMVEGSLKLDANKVKALEVPFTNAKLELKPSTDGQLHWKCKVEGSGQEKLVTEEASLVRVDLNGAGGAKCKIEVPPGLETRLEGANGKIELRKPQAKVDIKVSNGKIEIEPDAKKVYRYDLKVVNGLVGDFESSNDKGAIDIKVSATNGAIEKL